MEQSTLSEENVAAGLRGHSISGGFHSPRYHHALRALASPGTRPVSPVPTNATNEPDAEGSQAVWDIRTFTMHGTEPGAVKLVRKRWM